MRIQIADFSKPKPIRDLLMNYMPLNHTNNTPNAENIVHPIG